MDDVRLINEKRKVLKAIRQAEACALEYVEQCKQAENAKELDRALTIARNVQRATNV